MKNPYPAFLAHPGIAPGWAQNEPFIRDLQFERIPGTQLQFISNRLGKHDASGFIQRDRGSHNGIIPCHLPFRMAFVRYDHCSVTRT